MNLQTNVRSQLWNAISSTYEAGNYTSAILNAIHYLSDVLRDKAELDGDGTKLVSAALQSNPPKLRLNKLQTQTEKDIQAGVAQLLVGMYMGIRNPRSHELIVDTRETADAIIHFIDYLLGILAASEEVFTVDNFLNKVFDPDFVESEDYAKLLVEEIPKKKRLDTLIEIYRQKERGNVSQLRFLTDALLGILEQHETDEFMLVVSDELQTTTSNSKIKYNLQLLPSKLWQKLSTTARMRMENKLLLIIEKGEYLYWEDEIVDDGWLGTWARDFLIHFGNQMKVTYLLLRKFGDNDNSASVAYVAKYFMGVVAEIASDKLTDRFVQEISQAIIDNNPTVKSSFHQNLYSFPEEWKKKFDEALKDVCDENGHKFYVFQDMDDIPF